MGIFLCVLVLYIKHSVLGGTRRLFVLFFHTLYI
jgi:hypothetical protein